MRHEKTNHPVHSDLRVVGASDVRNMLVGVNVWARNGFTWFVMSAGRSTWTWGDVIQ